MLQDGEITLRKLVDSDKSTLAKLANNMKIWENVRDLFPHPYSESDAISFINSTLKEEPVVTFAIDFEGHLCGVTGLSPQKDVYKKSAEIGYWIGEDFWGKGIATRVVRLITSYGFDELKLARIHTGIFEHNIPSMRVLEKNGFKKEGVFKKAIFKNGKILDEHRYAIIKA